MTYASLLGRLQAAELHLHEKELAEERTRKLAAETRLRSLESWIHPHFLFNTLNSISALIASDPARAEQIVGRLATLLRASLDSSNHSLIPLRQEIAMVESYADIERVRFGDKLRASVKVPPELQETKVPPLSVQSLVENAVKHGITPQPNGGEFHVTARAVNDASTSKSATPVPASISPRSPPATASTSSSSVSTPSTAPTPASASPAATAILSSK